MSARASTIEALEGRVMLFGQLVADIAPGADGSFPSYFRVVSQKLTFAAAPVLFGDFDLYRLDSPLGALVRLDTFYGRESGETIKNESRTERSVVIGGRLLYQSDRGGAEGTILTASEGTLDSRLPLHSWQSPGVLIQLEARTLVNFPAGGGSLQHLWATDGTASGTVELANGTATSITSIEVIKERLALFALNSELWVTDGTPAGTHSIEVPGLQFGSRGIIASMGDTAVFFDRDSTSGKYRLWRTDGTVGGTRVVTDLPDECVGAWRLGDRAVFTIGHRGLQLWVTDGTAHGTTLLRADFSPGDDLTDSPARYAQLADGSLLLSPYPPSAGGARLWRTDGTESGTYRLTTLLGTGLRPSPQLFGGRVIFNVRGFGGENVTWETDGTIPGTHQSNVYAFLASPSHAAVGDTMYFRGSDIAHGEELWKVDTGTGTLAGSVFADSNGNGVKDLHESNSTGWRVFIDTDSDRVCDHNELSVRTSSTGRFEFPDLPAGKYRLRYTVVDGYVATTASSFLAKVNALETTTKKFGVVQAARIAGLVFNDANHNGIRDSAEAFLPGFRIYLDLDDDGHLDKNERFVRSDANGAFEFSNLLPGAYKIRLTAVAEWTSTTPTAFSTTLIAGGSSTKRFGLAAS